MRKHILLSLLIISPSVFGYFSFVQAINAFSILTYSTKSEEKNDIADTEQALENNMSSSYTESQLLAQLSPQGRAIYMSLDAEGKALAIQLASEKSYSDKNLAVKESQKRMNER